MDFGWSFKESSRPPNKPKHLKRSNRIKFQIPRLKQEKGGTGAI